MTLPWTCDALLPEHERFASLKFRRFARQFDLARVDYADACELFAFLHVLPIKWARHIFQWKKAGVRDAKILVERLADDAQAVAMARENDAAATVADGWLIIETLHACGYKLRGVQAPIVRRTAVSEPNSAALRRRLGVSREEYNCLRRGTAYHAGARRRRAGLGRIGAALGALFAE